MSTIKAILFGTTLLLSLAVRAQVPVVSVDPANGDAALATTEEEYNYLTKGYAIQVASGLDMKRGYSFIDLGSSSIPLSDGTRVVEFKGLVRDGQKAPCAILMTYKKSAGEPVYCCIPTYNADAALWERTMKQVHDAASAFNSSGMDTAIIIGLMHLSSSLATQ